jgi:hypothetical protein
MSSKIGAQVTGLINQMEGCTDSIHSFENVFYPC